MTYYGAALLEIKSSNAAPFLFPMKRLAGIITITLLALLFARPVCGQTTPVPASCWSMDETSGGVRSDSIGSSDFTFDMYSTVVSTIGMYGNAVQITEPAELHSPANSSTSFSWAMWVSPQNMTHGYDDLLSLTAYTVSMDNRRIRFADNNGNRLQSSIQNNSDWKFVVISYDADSGTGRLWLNDVHRQRAMVINVAVTAVAVLGKEYTGAVDEVAYFDYALTMAQATALYNSGAGVSCASIAPTPTPTPVPTATPAPTTQEITVTVAITTPYDINTVTLPSGTVGVIEYRITSGDVAIVALLSIQMTLLIYWIIRDHVKAVGVRNDANK